MDASKIYETPTLSVVGTFEALTLPIRPRRPSPS